jgi:ABC-2 type transport system ATP-binding protein
MAVLAGGRVVASGEPASLVAALRGRVWSTPAPLPDTAGGAPVTVLSERLQGGRSRLHVHSETPPGPSFERVEPDLRDVYFHALRGDAAEHP